MITEDRGLGYETREVRPTTARHSTRCRDGDLRPWKEHSGGRARGLRRGRVRRDVVGSTRAGDGNRYLLDLGSTAGGLGSVRVNDGDRQGLRHLATGHRHHR